MVAVGFFLSGGSSPVVPTPSTVDHVPTTSAPVEVTTTLGTGSVAAGQPESFDPFGEGGEGDQLVANLLDGDVSSEWQTERYLDPLGALKPGVGVTVRMQGTPVQLQIVGLSDGSVIEVYWSIELLADPVLW